MNLLKFSRQKNYPYNIKWGYSSRQELDRKLGLNKNIQSKVLAHYAVQKNVSGNILAKSYPLSSATGGELITLYTTAYFQLPNEEATKRFPFSPIILLCPCGYPGQRRNSEIIAPLD